jgi:hypothetical protein
LILKPCHCMTRLRGLQPASEWLGDGGGRWSNQPRIQPEPSYDWLQPCEGPREAAEREGPLKKIRPGRPSLPEASSPATGWLPKAETPQTKSKNFGARSVASAKKSWGKKPDTGIWAAGSPGPNGRVMSDEQRAWKAMAGGAVRAAAQVRMAGRSRSLGALRTSRPVQETPGIEAWDSVSQAGSEPGTPRSQRQADRDSEVMSAQTLQSSMAGESKMLDRIIEEWRDGNRKGCYNWHGGRVFG